MSDALRLLLHFFAGWVNRRQLDVIDYLKEENIVLREQLGGRRLRLTDAQRRRLAIRGKTIGRKALMEVACIGTPDTILRWYRQLIARTYDGSKRRRPGRPGLPRTSSSSSTVKRILLEHGIESAPERSKRTPWKAFLKAHWDVLAAADFFAVEVLTLGGLVRYSVFFVMELKTRRVQIAGGVAAPGALAKSERPRREACVVHQVRVPEPDNPVEREPPAFDDHRGRPSLSR